MARKSLGYVRLVWRCPQCESKVPGPIKVCGNCGFPQPENVAFEQPAQEVFVTDEAELAQAKAGPDIHCFYCDTRNSALRETCTQCGASLIEGQAHQIVFRECYECGLSDLRHMLGRSPRPRR